MQLRACNSIEPMLVVNGVEIEDKKVLSLLKRKGIEFLFIPCWKTMVKIPLEKIEEAMRYAEELSKVDKTFFWKIISSRLPDVRSQKYMLLVIYSPTKDLAYKRGGYFLHKLNLKSCKRIKKGYYWVKKYPSNVHYVDPQTGKIVVDEVFKEVLCEIKSKMKLIKHWDSYDA